LSTHPAQKRVALVVRSLRALLGFKVPLARVITPSFARVITASFCFIRKPLPGLSNAKEYSHGANRGYQKMESPNAAKDSPRAGNILPFKPGTIFDPQEQKGPITRTGPTMLQSDQSEEQLHSRLMLESRR
jgi:hypothetical protein